MQEPSTDAQQERVQEIPLSELHPFEGHPFRVADDEDMEKTVESIKEYGVLTPAIVRPDPYGGYEIISGHRRHHASGLAGKETMPAIVRDMDDDAAIILLVDSNLHRENILPSERAYAYRMKLDAITFDDCVVTKVERKQDSIESYFAHISSKHMEKYSWTADSRVTIEITNDAAYDPICFSFKVSEYSGNWLFPDKVVFEQE